MDLPQHNTIVNFISSIAEIRAFVKEPYGLLNVSAGEARK